VAVDTEHGLLVPVLRDVDRKSVRELAVELEELSQRARARKVGREELEGGCFTITNLGGIGGTGFTPIVHTPEVAILGVSRASREPRWDGEAFRPRLVLPLCLTYDHRVIDGADAARFLRWICGTLEEPMRLLLEA
jgi:pyruvate dehydrogenase E2 component (dihydrolipoamide acetyltransferase)